MALNVLQISDVKSSIKQMENARADDHYRAFVVTGPGLCKIVQRKLRRLRNTEVQLRVIACGICREDCELYMGSVQISSYPRVPGQEIVGFIEGLGPEVVGWHLGQRVGCGNFGGSCGICPACRKEDAIQCEHLLEMGVGVDGGLAERVVVEARALVHLPTGPAAVELAPLLGAGVTAFHTLSSVEAKAGDIVAVQGLGRVGSLALQFARHLGLQTVAISRGISKAKAALKFGAHAYIDSTTQNAAEILRSVGGARAIVATAPISSTWGDLLAGLDDRGTLIFVQKNSTDPLTFPVGDLLRGSRRLQAVRFGTPWHLEETLRFAIANQISCQSETVALEDLPRVFEREAKAPSAFQFVTEPISWTREPFAGRGQNDDC